MVPWNKARLDGEHYTYDYFQHENVCRLCWNNNAVVEITSHSQITSEHKSTIADIIQECVGIDVTSVTHPKKLCSNCAKEIEIYTEFRRFCQESDKRLHYIVKNVQRRITTIYVSIEDIKEENVELENECSLGISSDVQSKTDSLEREENNLVNNIKSLEINLEQNLTKAIEALEHKNELDVEKLESEEIFEKYESWDFEGKSGILEIQMSYCSICVLDLKSKRKLIEHNIEYHGMDQKGLFKCYGCKEVFKTTDLKLTHEATCKLLLNGYKCYICLKYLPHHNKLVSHLRLHRMERDPQKLYQCKHCYDMFKSLQLRREHIISTHNHKKTYFCEICGQGKFTRKFYFDMHMLTHTKKKPHKCPHCDHRTAYQSSLYIHIRKHTGERPYACDICPQRCISSSNLIKHRKSHLGLKEYECSACSKRFRYRESLSQHIKTAHKRSDPFKCPHCDVQYLVFNTLRKHILIKHRKRVKKVKDQILEVEGEVLNKRRKR